MLHCKRRFCCVAINRLTAEAGGRSVPAMSRPFARLLVLRCNMILAICSATGAVGCGNDAELCVRDSECASGFCRADGTCGPASDAMPADGDGMPGDGTTALCVPDHDGSVARAELPLAAGKMATFRIATDATFSTAGTSNGDGTRSWNLDLALANDADKAIALTAPTGQWWEASFPAASYAVRLAEGSDLLGVFQITDTELALLGVVSPDPGTFRTELEYDPPAKILALPLAPAASWSSTSTVSGTAQGAITAYTESYSSTVDVTGTMTTPYGDFPVIRVATDLDRTSFGTPIAGTRSFAWIAECFGSVANATSQSFETAQEFDDPAEVRRLVP